MKHGYALSQLPERFKAQPQPKQLAEYIARKYSKHGYRLTREIEYNPEFMPGEKQDGSKPSYLSADRYRWVENASKGLRHVGSADDIVKLGHTGWYIDNFQDETVRGEVYQLPAKDGECRFVPAVNDPNNDDCACVDFRSVTDDKEECARWADSMAESWAEREREYQAEESKRIRLEEIEDEIKSTYTGFRKVAREIRANCDRLAGIGVVRELVRKEWARTKAEIHKLRAERERLEEYGIEY